MKFGFLGPPGTFTQEALLQVVDPDAAELVYYASVGEVIEAVVDGKVERGMVPIENSVEGTVNATQDTLGFEHPKLFIQQEVIHLVRLHLLGRRGCDPKKVTDVFSMPHATAQCRKWLRENLPDAKIHATNSTAEAAGRVAYEHETATAIGPMLAAQLYNLEVIYRDVSDHTEAETRFVVIGRELAAATGRDKTSIVAFISEDKPGALLEILQVFNQANINLTKLESRPTKRVLGEYCFFIDLEGHIDEPHVSKALDELKTHSAEVRNLGSYARAVGARDAERLARKSRSANISSGQ